MACLAALDSHSSRISFFCVMTSVDAGTCTCTCTCTGSDTLEEAADAFEDAGPNEPKDLVSNHDMDDVVVASGCKGRLVTDRTSYLDGVVVNVFQFSRMLGERTFLRAAASTLALVCFLTSSRIVLGVRLFCRRRGRHAVPFLDPDPAPHGTIRPRSR